VSAGVVNFTWPTPTDWGTVCGQAYTGALRFNLYDANHNIIHYAAVTGMTSYQYTLNAGKYMWSITLANGGLTEDRTSPEVVFLVGNAICTSTSIAPISLLSPAADEVVEVTANIVLTWNPVATFGINCSDPTEDRGYRITIDGTTTYTVSETTTSYTVASLDEATHLWAVTAYSGLRTQTTAQRSFTVCVPSLEAPTSTCVTGSYAQPLTLSWTNPSTPGKLCGHQSYNYSVAIWSTTNPHALFYRTTAISMSTSVTIPELSWLNGAESFTWSVVSSAADHLSSVSSCTTMTICTLGAPAQPDLSVTPVVSIAASTTFSWTQTNGTCKSSVPFLYHVAVCAGNTFDVASALKNATTTQLQFDATLAEGEYVWSVNTWNG
jgi:hypothetical protein